MAYKKPESALVVLYDQHYRVLLLQRQDDPPLAVGNRRVRRGELPLETAYREVCEEIGIDAKAHGFVVNDHERFFGLALPCLSGSVRCVHDTRQRLMRRQHRPVRAA